MEGTYSTSCYINNIMLKILGKTGDVQKNQQNYLGTKKYFAVADRGTFIGHDRLTYFISPLRPILE